MDTVKALELLHMIRAAFLDQNQPEHAKAVTTCIDALDKRLDLDQGGD